MENLYLIVGLGNPGAEYSRTRHNAGFILTDELARRWRGNWALEKKFHSRLARVERNGRRLILCQPQQFMNVSGGPVSALLAFYRIPAGQWLVAVDDADLPLGQIRLRPGGSSGGHHGLESIESQVGTRDFARLRLGIGRTADGGREIAGHVLGKFGAAEAALMDKVVARASGQIECWLDSGIAKAMSQFNGVVEDPGQQRQTE